MNPKTKTLRGEMLKQWLKNRATAVLGLGKSGIAVTKTLSQLGAKLFLSEAQSKPKIQSLLPPFFQKFPAEFGKHSAKILENELIVISPGVDWNHPLLIKARKKGILVWGELELAYRLANFKKIVAVTGTNGKTTTVSLIGELCKRSQKKTLVAGNIGKPLIDYALATKNFDIAVLEVSSYQLEGIDSFHPEIAAVLNLSSDHLHRHKSMQNYAKAKFRIFSNQNQNDFAVLNQDNPWCRRMAKECPSSLLWFSTQKKLKRGIYWDGDEIIAKLNEKKIPMRFAPPRNLLGIHNIENGCAAIAVALALHLPAEGIQKGLFSFGGVPHRLEKVRILQGVTYINDSKATNVESTAAALRAISSPIWLILGGEDKGSSYRPLKSLIANKVKGIFLIGEAAKKIYSDLQNSCQFSFAKTLKRAVAEGFRKASQGETVLLSPACASFDQFKNFEDRGEQFKKLVREL